MRWLRRIYPFPRNRDRRGDVDDRLRRSLHERSYLLDRSLPPSPSDDVLDKILQGIDARRNRKRKAALTAAGVFAVAVIVAGVASTSAGLLGITSHTSQSTHAPTAGVAAPTHAASTESARPGAIASQLMHRSQPACAAGTLNGQLLAGCTGTVTARPVAYGAASPALAANAGAASNLQRLNGLPAESTVPTCSSAFLKTMSVHGLDAPVINHQISQAAATLAPGEYLEVALAPLTRLSKWVLEPSSPGPTSTSNTSTSSTSSHSHAPVLSLCTVQSPVAGGMVMVAKALSPGTRTITAHELVNEISCGGKASIGTSLRCTTGKATRTTYQAASYRLTVVVDASRQ